MVRAAWILGALSVLAFVPAAEGDEVCDRCKPARAVWPWKANSYVLGTTDAGAVEAGEAAGEELACKKAHGYLRGGPTCRMGCEAAGAINSTCERTKKACMHGSYESKPSMWMFVCRKYQYEEGGEPCSPERAAKEPYWSMCEVFVKAEQTMPCDCIDEG